MIPFTIHRLDRRHKGYNLFTYYITPVWSSQLVDKLKFYEWRKWCWTTWGPGIEREQALDLDRQYWKDENLRWCWHTEDGARRLYFATEKELNWFKLTWMA
jgi:hypothetical protein